MCDKGASIRQIQWTGPRSIYLSWLPLSRLHSSGRWQISAEDRKADDNYLHEQELNVMIDSASLWILTNAIFVSPTFIS